jgi:hypothetical protein
MHFLIDASLPRSTAALLRQRGHDATDVRDVGPALALDPAIAAYAKANQFALITADFDFADVRAYPPADYAGIVVIDRPQGATVSAVLAPIERLLDAPDVLAALPGRLAIVDVLRIRLRPALPDNQAQP